MQISKAIHVAIAHTLVVKDGRDEERQQALPDSEAIQNGSDETRRREKLGRDCCIGRWRDEAPSHVDHIDHVRRVEDSEQGEE
jgi:hypothetical protein